MAVAAVAAGGALIGGVSQLIGAFNQPSGPAQIDPAIQAALQSGQLDLNTYISETNAAQWGINTGWQQSWQQFDAATQRALQAHFAANFGVAEQGFTDYVTRVSRGEPSQQTINLIASQQAQQGQVRRQQMSDVENYIASHGLATDSPVAQEMRNRAMRDLGVAEGAQTAQTLSSQSQFELNTANQMFNDFRNAREYATMNPNNLPGLPQTQQQSYDARLSDLQNQLAQAQDAYNNSPTPGFFGAGPRMQLQQQIQSIQNQIASLQSSGPFPGGAGVGTTTNRLVPTWEEANPNGTYSQGPTQYVGGTMTGPSTRGSPYVSYGSGAPSYGSGGPGTNNYLSGGGGYSGSAYMDGRTYQMTPAGAVRSSQGYTPSASNASQIRTSWLLNSLNYGNNGAATPLSSEQISSYGITPDRWNALQQAVRQARVSQGSSFNANEDWLRQQGVNV